MRDFLKKVKIGHVETTWPNFRGATHLEGDGLLQDVKQELQLEQGSSVGRVGGQREEPMLLAPGQQVLFKQPGELLQAGRRQGQRAAAAQHQVAWRLGETINFTLFSFFVFK